MQSEKFNDDDSEPDSRPPSASKKPRRSQISRRARNSMGRSPKSREVREIYKQIEKLNVEKEEGHKVRHHGERHHSVIAGIHRHDNDNPYLMFTRRQKECYFGPHARMDFFDRFKDISRRSDTIPDRNYLATIGRSPRSEFLANLQEVNELPWPILSRSLHAPRVIDLSGMGLGDKVISALTKILEKLPQCDTLMLGDNRLTDDSLTDLLEKVTHMPNLTHLDISFNDMDDSSKTILKYLSEEDCSLRILCMENADIDDFECGDLMEALKINKSLKSLDLKDNLLGEKEQLNVVMPELLTGGEAIADMLTVNSTLTELDVSWNSIRGDSAMELAECLEDNNTLVTLILSHNAFGDHPSQYLGDILSRNTSLTHLDLSYNAVRPAAAMVIANAFKKNHTLDKLQLNGNTIGRRGAETLMQALRRHKREEGNLFIEISNCDCEYEDRDLFDPVEPTKVSPDKYVLDMSLPYSRMVMDELVRMANERPGAYFPWVKHRKSGERGGEYEPIELTQSDGPPVVEGEEKEEKDGKGGKGGKGDKGKGKGKGKGKDKGKDKGKEDPKAEKAAKAAAKLAAEKAAIKTLPQNWKLPVKKIVDELSDGVIDEPDNLNADLRELLDMFGLHPSIDTVDKIMWSLDLSVISEETILDTIFRSIFHLVDIDGSQCVDFNEMKIAMSLLAVRVDDEQVKRIIAEYDIDKSGEIEEDEFVSWMINHYAKQKEAGKVPVKHKGQPWVPPDSGVIQCEFHAERMPPHPDEVGSDIGISRLLWLIDQTENEADKAKLFDKATSNSDIYMTAKQAQDLLDVGPKGGQIQTIRKLLPQMADPQQCCQLVHKNLAIREVLNLRKQMGPGFGTIMGNASGRYVLDLENELHRVGARKLAELNNYEKR